MKLCKQLCTGFICKCRTQKRLYIPDRDFLRSLVWSIWTNSSLGANNVLPRPRPHSQFHHAYPWTIINILHWGISATNPEWWKSAKAPLKYGSLGWCPLASKKSIYWSICKGLHSEFSYRKGRLNLTWESMILKRFRTRPNQTKDLYER